MNIFWTLHSSFWKRWLPLSADIFYCKGSGQGFETYLQANSSWQFQVEAFAELSANISPGAEVYK